MSGYQDQQEKLELEQAVARLAALPSIQYDRIRQDEADRFGCRVSTLDKEVERRRSEAAGQGADMASRAFSIEDDDPFPVVVDGDVLLGELVALIKRHAILPDGAALPVAVWSFGTYLYDRFPLWPKLLITSPEKRCGKSTLSEIIGGIVSRALPCSNITAPALFRCIEKWKPTLLLDEADTFIRDNEELRGVINAGHTRASAYVIRLCGDDHEPRQFSVWAPMLIAMIKLPADTIIDRSVIVQMRRKLPGEAVDKLPVTFREDCRVIRQKIARWAADHAERLSPHVEVPAHANDRTVDNWSPLFGIATAIGGRWAEQLRESFRLLNPHTQDDAIGPQILADIRDVFQAKGVSRIFSDDLVNALIEIDDSPWSEWRHGKPLTKNSLARLLKPFGIHSKGTVRIGNVTRKGYERDDFLDAFSRYLQNTPVQTVTPSQASNHAAFGDFQNVTPKTAKQQNVTRKPSSGGPCDGVTFENTPFQQASRVTL